jgi:hypothetical protein
MKIVIKILILSIGLLLTGCEDIIEIDLNTAPPQLVIDASIDWAKNTAGNEQKIKLSTTTGYYSDDFPTVSGATVTVNNTANTVFSFTENPGTGEYNCANFVPIIGETYTLTIVLNGQTYTATETLLNVPDVEDTIDQNNTGGFGGDEVEITYYFQDNGAQDNYYLHGFVDPRIAFPEYHVENDENNQGNRTPVFYANKDLKPGDIINIKFYGISKRYFDYFKKLSLASGNGGSPFQTTPVGVRGNIVNQTNAKNFAYGYFRLSEVVARDYTIQ